MHASLKPHAAMVASLLILLLPACTDEPDHPPLHPVEGSVTWRGEPAEGATVILHPQVPNDTSEPRPNGQVAADGTFQLGTYGTADGAPVGSYGVTIEWPEPGKPLEGPGPDRLRGRYANPRKPEWTIEVKEGPNQLEPFVLR